jgi:hypothetical protein
MPGFDFSGAKGDITKLSYGIGLRNFNGQDEQIALLWQEVGL